MKMNALWIFLKKMAPGLSTQDFTHPDALMTDENISKLGICVDPTAINIENAVKSGIRVLISYHPWHGEAKEYIESGQLQIWPLHEAWDNVAEGGLYTLAKGIGVDGLYLRGELLIGQVETGFRDLIENCQRFLGQNILSFSGDLKQEVHKVAMWAGPGFLPQYKKFWDASLSENCDTFLSSELTLSALRYSRARRLKLIDLGHSLLAKPGMLNVAEILKKEAQDCLVQFLDDLYVCTYYTNCSFADQFTETEDIFFGTEG